MANVSFWIGWIFLIGSWTIPYLVKDQKKRLITGLILSSLALGIFIGGFVDSVFKL